MSTLLTVLRRQPAVIRYALAIAVSGLVIALRVLVDPIVGDRILLGSGLVAIIFVAWCCGLGPAVLTAGLALTAQGRWFLDTRDTLTFPTLGQLLELVLYMLTGSFIIAIVEANRRASDKLDRTRTMLKEGVKQRTAELQERAIQLNEQADLLDLANDAIFATRGGKISYWSKGAERLYGWSRAETAGRSPSELLMTDFPLPLPQILERLNTTGYWEGDMTQTKRDGAKLRVASRWSVRRDPQGNPVGYLVINTDISRRKQAEDGLRELSARLIQLQDEERRRIARELHDSTGQTLVALSINLSALKSQSEGLSPQAVRIMTDSLELVQEITKEVRTLSYLLHPPLLDEAGLSSALRWYVEGFSKRSNIRVKLELCPTVGRLGRELETAIFRIVQESLTNVHRHSASPSAEIRIDRERNLVCVEIEDHGKGMPPLDRRPSSSGVGIAGMRERIYQLGGTLEIQSGQKGTLIRAALPVDWPIKTDGRERASEGLPRGAVDLHGSE